MNYIVFDLEWNQCPYGKGAENEKIPFEVIEIGAVKLDDDKKIIDSFQQYIRPTVYKRMHFHAAKVTGLTMDDLSDGMGFAEAAKKFIEWCGDDCTFCSWGEQDLTEFQRNLKYYGILDILEGPMLYENIQWLYSMAFEEEIGMRSLEYVANALKMDLDFEFHHALDDAIYAAKIFEIIPDDIVIKYPSVNTYQNPKKRKDEIVIDYEDSEVYVSREFSSKEAAMSDIVVRDLHCNFCKENLKPIIKWYSKSSKNYYALGKCKLHGFIRGKIHMMHNDEDKFYTIKTLEQETEEGAKEQLEKKAKKE